MNRTAPALSRTFLAASLVAFALVLAACTGESDTGSSSAAESSTATESSGLPGTESPTSAAPADAGAEPSSPADSDEADTAVVEVSAFEFGYSVSATEVPAGEVTFELRNDGGTEHDLVLEDGPGGATAVIGPQETATLTVELEPGTYTLYCSVGTHRALGMEFTITVS